jgi:hypothetical protein
MSRTRLGILAALGVALGAWSAVSSAQAAEGGGPGLAPKAAPVPAQRWRTSVGPNGAQKLVYGGTAPTGPQTSAATPGDTEPLTVLKTGPNYSRLVYRVKALPASDLERTIRQLFRSEGELHGPPGTAVKGQSAARVAIVSSPVSNTLVIGGPPDVVEEVRSLVEKLDQPSGQVLIEMELGETSLAEARLAEAPKPIGTPSAPADPFRLTRRPAKMETVRRIRLTTMDNIPAFIQMGERVPRVTGVVQSNSGETRSVDLVNVGTILGVTPRIAPDRSVVMEVNVEQSRVGPEEEGVPISIAANKAVLIRTPEIDTAMVQSTITIPEGQSMILGSAVRRGKSDKALVIVITPHILAPGEAGKSR